MKKYSFRVPVFLLGMVLSTTFVVGCDRRSSNTERVPTSQAELYPYKWDERFNTEISSTLAKNKITGCGQYQYREYYKPGRGEFLVACTKDGKHWEGYNVFTLVNKVVGPIKLTSPPS